MINLLTGKEASPKIRTLFSWYCDNMNDDEIDVIIEVINRTRELENVIVFSDYYDNELVTWSEIEHYV